MGKFPYIPDKDLYAAVIFACKMIRKDGYFNKDCRIAANYYKVDENDVKRYVRIAQGNGQKAANKHRGKQKYYWYAAVYVPDWEPNWDKSWAATWTQNYTLEECVDHTKTTVVRALNEHNAKHNVMGGPKNPDLACEDDGGYRWNRVMHIEEFSTKKEAEAYVETLGTKEIESIVITYKKEVNYSVAGKSYYELED